MGNEDGKCTLDNLYLVLKGEKTMFVDKELYEQLEELKDKSFSLCDAYTFMDNDVSKYKLAYWWFSTNDSSTNREHEKDMLDWMDGTLEIKPRPETKYKVWQLLGKDGDGDKHFTGLVNRYGIITLKHQMTNQMYKDDFDSLTEKEIQKFQADTGIKLPNSMWHEVVENEED
jgi:hypothetical protein